MTPTPSPPRTLPPAGDDLGVAAARYQQPMPPTRPSRQVPPGTTSREEPAMAAADPIPSTVTLASLGHPAVPLGFAPDSIYVEACYLPRLGPTSFVAYRHLSALLQGGDPTTIDLLETARNLGLRPGAGRSAPLMTALAHLEAFGLAAWQGRSRYAVRLVAPALTDRQAQRLPQRSRRIHYTLTAVHGGDR